MPGVVQTLEEIGSDRRHLTLVRRLGNSNWQGLPEGSLMSPGQALSDGLFFLLFRHVI